MESTLRVVIDGSQAQPTADKLTSSLDKLTLNGAKVDGAFAQMSAGIKASSPGMAAHARDTKGASDALGVFAGASNRAKTEILVLLHELSQGQTRRFGGSLLVLAEQLDIAGKIMSPTGLALVALTATAAAFGDAIYGGSQQVAEFNKDIQLSGGYAGITRGQYETMIGAIASQTGGKLGAARDTLSALVKGGQFTALSLQQVARAIDDVSDASGEDSKKVISDFQRMSSGVAKWAADANSSYHFLSTAQYEQISSLERQGKTQEAAALTSKLLADQLEAQKAPLTGLSSLWHTLGLEISGAWAALQKGGQSDTINDQIRAQQKVIADLQAQASQRVMTGRFTSTTEDHSGDRVSLGRGMSTTVGEQLARAQTQLAALQQQLLAQQAAAASKSAFDVAAQQGIAYATSANEDVERLKEMVATYGQGQAAVERFKQAKALLLAQANPDAAARAQEIADIKKNGAAAIALAVQYDTLVNAKKKVNQQYALDRFNERIDSIVGGATATGNAALDAYNKKLLEVAAAETTAQREGVTLVDVFVGQARGAIAAAVEFADATAEFRKGFDQQTAAIEASAIDDPYTRRVVMAQQAFAKEAADYQKKLDNETISQDEFDRAMAASAATRDKAYRTPVDDLVREWANGSAQIQQLTADTMRSFVDTIAAGVVQGKLSFKSFADAAIEQLIRIQLQKAAASLFGASSGGGSSLTSLLGGIASFFGGTGGAPAPGIGDFSGPRAAGGPVVSGKSYLVGEQGPELITPAWAGNVIPAGKTAGMFGGGGSITVDARTSIDARGADPSMLPALYQLMRRNSAETEARIREQIQRGVFV